MEPDEYPEVLEEGDFSHAGCPGNGACGEC